MIQSHSFIGSETAPTKTIQPKPVLSNFFNNKAEYKLHVRRWYADRTYRPKQSMKSLFKDKS